MLLILMNYQKTFFDYFINKTCKLLLVKNDSQKLEIEFIIKLFLDQKYKIISLDLEFNNKNNSREIALFQLGFNIKSELIIVIFNPYITPEIYLLIEPLLINMDIIKIGHGTDSLDIPLIYKLLKTNEKITNFIMKLYDTRFLCEYVNIITGNVKCNIYNCLNLFSVVDVKQIEFLNNIEKKIGKFWLHDINILSLSDNVLNYAMYDVVYLKKLLKNIKKTIINLDLDYNLILQVTRFMFLTRIKIININNNSKKEYFIKKLELFTQKCDKKYYAILKCSLFKKYIHNLLMSDNINNNIINQFPMIRNLIQEVQNF